MEREHPIPQQISSYQFRLVGDMTLKQFFQVAGGALVSLILYSSGMPGFIKWPLIIISFLSGVAFAFFPLQDRPLSTWLWLFFKAIYSPTLFVWKRGAEKRQFFQAEPDDLLSIQQTQSSQPDSSLSLKSLQDKKPPEEVNLEEKEKQFLDKVGVHLQTILTHTPKSQAKPQNKREEVKVPHSKPVGVEPTIRKELVPTPPEVTYVHLDLDRTPTPSSQSKIEKANAAQFSPAAAPPTPPNKANVVVGQVVDSNQNIIDGALLEIRDSDGRPVRALKSNRLGHFMIVTPLLDGEYQIITEKEGFNFEAVKFVAKGEIIPPISIIGKVNNND